MAAYVNLRPYLPTSLSDFRHLAGLYHSRKLDNDNVFFHSHLPLLTLGVPQKRLVTIL